MWRRLLGLGSLGLGVLIALPLLAGSSSWPLRLTVSLLAIGVGYGLWRTGRGRSGERLLLFAFAFDSVSSALFLAGDIASQRLGPAVLLIGVVAAVLGSLASFLRPAGLFNARLVSGWVPGLGLAAAALVLTSNLLAAGPLQRFAHDLGFALMVAFWITLGLSLLLRPDSPRDDAPIFADADSERTTPRGRTEQADQADGQQV